MRKKVDERIRTLIENGVKNRHRSMFVIIGDKSRDQVPPFLFVLFLFKLFHKRKRKDLCKISQEPDRECVFVANLKFVFLIIFADCEPSLHAK